MESCKESLSYYEKCGKRLFLLCWFAYCISYIGRYNYSVCMTSMIASGVMDESAGGVISACFLITYGSGQLINGILGDRFHPKNMIAIGLIGSGISNLLMGFSNNFVLSCIAWCVNGYSCSMLWCPVVRCFAEFMLMKQRMIAAVNISITMPVGNLLCYGLSSVILNSLNWKSVFYIFGLILLASGGVWYTSINSAKMREYFVKIKEKKAELGEGVKVLENPAKKKSFNTFTLLISTGAIFVSIAAFMNGMLKESVLQFVPKFLYDCFGVNESQASAVSMIIPIVNVFGAYAASYLLKKVFKNELATISSFFVVSAVSSILLFTIGGYNIILAALLISVTTSVMVGANTLIMTFIPLNYSNVGLSSTYTGLLDAFAYIASASATVVFGAVSAGSNGWNAVIVLWGLIGAIGFAVTLAGTPLWKKSRVLLNENAEMLMQRHAK